MSENYPGALETSLAFGERRADDAPAGLLILHHGRGSDEHDLVSLADLLDPNRRLHIVAPRAPFQLPGWQGYHWYQVPRVGYPDPETFQASYRELAAFHDGFCGHYQIEPSRMMLGGFSMGTVMSYALGLGPDRPAPAGILALSGFIPTVEGWHAEIADRKDMPVFITHGRNDVVIDVSFARTARDLLEQGGLEVEYHETDAAHHVDPTALRSAGSWIEGVL